MVLVMLSANIPTFWAVTPLISNTFMQKWNNVSRETERYMRFSRFCLSILRALAISPCKSKKKSEFFLVLPDNDLFRSFAQSFISRRFLFSPSLIKVQNKYNMRYDFPLPLDHRIIPCFGSWSFLVGFLKRSNEKVGKRKLRTTRLFLMIRNIQVWIN